MEAEVLTNPCAGTGVAVGMQTMPTGQLTLEEVFTVVVFTGVLAVVVTGEAVVVTGVTVVNGVRGAVEEFPIEK